MDPEKLNETARALVAPGKGILAADESTGTMGKRLKAIGVENTEENRIAYRGAMFTAPNMEENISGVILYDETLRQKVDGTPVPQVLRDRGVLPGIKVDKGAKPLAFSEDETITEGLDGLRDRLKEYRELGATFTKWRAVIHIGDGRPTEYAIHTNAHALARYAALAQEADLVPIVEPEVLMDGDHDIETCFDVTEATLQAVFHELHEQGVLLEGMVLKPNMVVPGLNASQQASDEEIAEATVACFRRTVPSAVPGIVFLSGGMSDEHATSRLNEMNKMGPHPWELSFSYGRALQQAALNAWSGNPSNLPAAQKAFVHRARMNGLARSGEYDAELEKGQ